MVHHSLGLLLFLTTLLSCAQAFIVLRHTVNHRQTSHLLVGDDDALNLPISPSSAFEDSLFLERFKRRRDDAAARINAERLQRPPSSKMDPKEMVTSILNGLLQPHEPLPYFGYEILYSSSTSAWKDTLRKSIGAPVGTADELIYRALSTSFERPDTQFGILVGLGTDEDYSNNINYSASSSSSPEKDEYYTVEFPFDPLDYFDGTAWLECRLRDTQSDKLLVVLGWSLQQRESDGAWLIEGIDWQDFRDKYRPGYGREEWERICG